MIALLGGSEGIRYASVIPSQTEARAKTPERAKREVGVGGEAMGGAGRNGDQAEQEQGADGLRGLSAASTPTRSRKPVPSGCDGDAAGRGDARVDRGEEQRPRDHEHPEDEPDADDGGELAPRPCSGRRSSRTGCERR